jgi:hypothetical protein
MENPMPDNQFTVSQIGSHLMAKLALKSELRKLAMDIIWSAFPEAVVGTGNFTQKEIKENDDNESVIYDQGFECKNVKLCLRAIRKMDEATFSILHLTNSNFEQVEIKDLSKLREIVTSNFCTFAQRLEDYLVLKDIKMKCDINLSTWPITTLVCNPRGCSLTATFEPDGKCHAVITRGQEKAVIDETVDIKRMDVFADLIFKKIDGFGPITDDSTDSTSQAESSGTPIKASPCDFCELGKEVTSDCSDFFGAIYSLRYSKETGEVTITNDGDKGVGVFKFPKCPFCGKPLGKPAEQQA